MNRREFLKYAAAGGAAAALAREAIVRNIAGSRSRIETGSSPSQGLLGNLGDARLLSLLDRDILSYNGSNQKWENRLRSSFLHSELGGISVDDHHLQRHDFAAAGITTHDNVQSGTETITVAANTNTATAAVLFPTQFAGIPRVVTWLETAIQGLTIIVIIPFLVPDSAAIVWTNMPAAVTELLGLTIHRTRAITQSVTGNILTANVITPGPAGSTLRAQYSSDGIAWTNLSNTVSIAAAGVNRSTTIATPNAAKSSSGIYLRIVGAGGDGVVDPEFGTLLLEFSQSSQGTFTDAEAIASDGSGFTLRVSRGFNALTDNAFTCGWLAYLP